jgi:hypothetical protein
MKVYYLNWDVDDEDEKEAADDVRAAMKFDDEYPDSLEEYRFMGSYPEADEPEQLWNALNRNPEGYHKSLDEKEERSMSVGDAVVDGDDVYFCVAFGFEKVEGVDV